MPLNLYFFSEENVEEKQMPNNLGPEFCLAQLENLGKKTFVCIWLTILKEFVKQFRKKPNVFNVLVWSLQKTLSLNLESF